MTDQLDTAPLDFKEDCCDCECNSTGPKDVEVEHRLLFINPNLRIGFHITKEKTLYKSIQNLLTSPLSAFQIYISNARSFQPPKVEIKDIMATQQLLFENSRFLCIHGSLLYNLCGSTDVKDAKLTFKQDRIVTALSAELDVGVGLGRDKSVGVVVHIGSCKDKKLGIKRIAETIVKALNTDSCYTSKLSNTLKITREELRGKRLILLENSAAEGTKLGSTLDEIRDILELVPKKYKPQVKVCIDSAHIYGSGVYNFGKPSDVKDFYESFDKLIGLNKLHVFHFNDSRALFGSRKDRHENLTLGHIFSGSGVYGLKEFLGYAEKYNIPLVGEPPAMKEDKTVAPGGRFDYNIVKTVFSPLLTVVYPHQIRVAIIGNAHLDDDGGLKKLYENMNIRVIEILKGRNLVPEKVTFISGGAAISDHVAINLTLKNGESGNPVGGCELYLPCEFDSKFYDSGDTTLWKTNPGYLANLYHSKFSKALGINSLKEISEVISKETTIVKVFDGFHKRNNEVAKNCDIMIAFQLREVLDGGTKYTFDKCKLDEEDKILVTMEDLVDIT